MPIKLYLYAAIIIAVGGYIGWLNYRIMQYETTIAKQETVITQYKANEVKLKDANSSLQTELKDYEKAASTYADMVSKSHTQTESANRELQKMRMKLASHNLQKLRDSRHAESVLKIINNSIRKDVNAYSNLGAPVVKPTPAKEPSK